MQAKTKKYQNGSFKYIKIKLGDVAQYLANKNKNLT